MLCYILMTCVSVIVSNPRTNDGLYFTTARMPDVNPRTIIAGGIAATLRQASDNGIVI